MANKEKSGRAKEPKRVVFFHKDTPQAVVDAACAQIFAKIGRERRAAQVSSASDQKTPDAKADPGV